MVTYTEPGDNTEIATGHGGIHSAHTVRVATDEPLWEALYAWVNQQRPDNHGRIKPIFLTTEYRWSGYSEETISEEWTVIVVSVPDLDLEQQWDTLPEFLRDMLKAVET